MLMSTSTLHAQYSPSIDSAVFTSTIQDGSFEGPQPTFWSPPPTPIPSRSWHWCEDGANSPDLQPGYWRVTVPPFHGSHYAGLITKNYRNKVYGESIAAPLSFTVDSPQFITFRLANNPIQNNRDSSIGGRMQLMIRRDDRCPEKPDFLTDTIWTSPLINSPEWEFQVVNFTSPVPKGFLIFQIILGIDSVKYTNLTNILIDDIQGPFPGSLEKPDLGPDQTLCEGDTLWMNLENKAPSVELTWQDGSDLTRYSITKTGSYIATFTLGEALLSDTIHVTFELPIEPGFPSDSVICKQNDFLLGPTRSDYAYAWSDGVAISPRPIDKSGYYHLEASNGVCTVYDSVLLMMTDCEIKLEMPNVFSPNGDGINEVFQPMEHQNIKTYQLLIYDRWGRQVADLRSVFQGWDGRGRNNQPAPAGVYFWVAQFQGPSSEEIQILKGSVTLVR